MQAGAGQRLTGTGRGDDNAIGPGAGDRLFSSRRTSFQDGRRSRLDDDGLGLDEGALGQRARDMNQGVDRPRP